MKYTKVTKEELKNLSVEELEERMHKVGKVLQEDYRSHQEPKLHSIYWREKEESGVDYRAYEDALKASTSAKRAITKVKNQGDLYGNGWPKRLEEQESPKILDKETTKAYKAKIKEAKDMLEEEITKYWSEKKVLEINFDRMSQALSLRVNRNKDLEEELERNTKALNTIEEDLIKAIEKLKEEKVAKEARLKKTNEEIKNDLKVDINSLIDAMVVKEDSYGY